MKFSRAAALFATFAVGIFVALPWLGIANPRILPGVRAGANGATGAAYTFTYGTYTATGTVQGTCTPITTNVANITAGDGKAACLPAAGSVSVGDIYEVMCSVSASPGGYNAGSFQHYCLIFPTSGGTITPFSANAADTIPAGMVARYRFKGSSTWAAEHGAYQTSDGNSTYGLVYAYGDINMGGGGSATARLVMSGNSGNQINMSGAGENKISFPDNTASAFYFWTLSDGNKYLEFVSTNSGEKIQTYQPIYVGTNPGQGVIQMNGFNGNQINFDINNGNENYIGISNNNPIGLEFQVRGNGTNMLVFNTTSNAFRVVHNVPIVGATGSVAAAGATQSGATQIVLSSRTDFQMTACDGTKGVALPTGSTFSAVRLMAQSSTVTNTCKVYGANSEDDTINGGAADAAYVQPAGTSLLYRTDDGVNWFTY